MTKEIFCNLVVFSQCLNKIDIEHNDVKTKVELQNELENQQTRKLFVKIKARKIDIDDNPIKKKRKKFK